MNMSNNKKHLKKYGLVWDTSNEEKVGSDTKMPLIIEDTSMKIGDDGDNILIEGENYYALSVLNFTHQKKIDVIYIDPPYNTGNQFIYNDRRVNREDAYRHSKWLSFMEKRLVLARRLLKSTGMIFISIDENELAQLKLLCDEIFGEKNLLAVQVWRGMHTVRNSSKDFNHNVEFILSYARSKSRLIDGKNGSGYLRVPADKSKNYPYDDDDGNGAYKLDPLHARNKYTNYTHTFKRKNELQIQVQWTAPEGRYPAYSRDTLAKMEEAGRIVFSGDILRRTDGSMHECKNKEPSAKRYLKDVQEGVPPNTLVPEDEAGFNMHGTSELGGMFGAKVFDQPKPVSLIKYLLSIGNGKHNARNNTVLDFFAGSGTTGHAVLQLNRDDGGNRRFILCTTNDEEKNICTDVCHPRLEKAINGYYKETDSGSKHVEGLGGGVRYFRMSMVDSASTDYNKRQIVKCINSILCMRSNCFDVVSKAANHVLFRDSSNKKQMGLLYDAKGADALKSAIRKQNIKTTVYVFSLDMGVGEYEFDDMSGLVDLKPTPQDILDLYKSVCLRRRRGK